ncbi:class I SAM-dependent methyltransferase [Telmatocola sphagniphila]|uniref:Class I SAM-dependent methyltransferase n=1 Tax=Telmatocola sphagniphila TaxID=1123043 RepID=A0A8E6ETS9_9BACT|nr:class I SAM-dependent methyltransferase [Telmatocola sphagniphila]QVL32809.1 class I SAM-dependent methyltransferase [Telmatocola sphagniphila]
MSFDLLAPHYHWIEKIVFGDSLQKCRIGWLDSLKDAKRVLIIGEGDGRFLREFLRANPLAVVKSIDFSRKMRELAKRRMEAAGIDGKRVQFQTGDIRKLLVPEGTFDLVITNFLLDCFDEKELQPVIALLSSALIPGGLWVVGDFRIPSISAAARRARWRLRMMYFCFRLSTRLQTKELVNFDPLLASHGLVLLKARSWQNGFLSSEIWKKRKLQPSERAPAIEQPDDLSPQ